ncbi:hypothetical protein [Marinomonas sp. THO17]|uniref:TreTu family toxin n=1 Tax=Marinomonas sp. THO17 TaxID=3149048 RepID=UPI00336BECD1
MDAASEPENWIGIGLLTSLFKKPQTWSGLFGKSKVTKKTVGRWMSPDELAKMKKTGKAQESYSGTTHVADPANPEAFIKQTKVGNVYAEFDVPASSLKKTNKDWAQIVGPNSATGRFAARKGNPVPQMPDAENIVHKATKIR